MTIPVPTGERTLPGIPSENYWFRRHEAAYRFAMRLARGVVVDAGCGQGYGAAMLARRGRVVGLDLDPPTVRRAAAAFPEASFAVADLCHLPVASADAVVALQVLEHLWCPRAFLEASARALRPGGVLVISTPNARTFPTGRNPSHVHEYTAEEVRGLLEQTFPIVRLGGLGHGAALRVLDRVLEDDVQRVLIGRPYEEQPRWLRVALRRVRARHFTRCPPDLSLDVLAVCRGSRRLPSPR